MMLNSHIQIFQLLQKHNILHASGLFESTLVFLLKKLQIFSRIHIHLFANHPIDFGIGVEEAAENYFFDGSGDIAQNCFKGDLCGLFFWEMVNSGRNVGKRNDCIIIGFNGNRAAVNFPYSIISARPDIAKLVKLLAAKAVSKEPCEELVMPKLLFP